MTDRQREGVVAHDVGGDLQCSGQRQTCRQQGGHAVGELGGGVHGVYAAQRGARQAPGGQRGAAALRAAEGQVGDDQQGQNAQHQPPPLGEEGADGHQALVTPGRLPEPRSVKASVNAGTATAMMMTKTTMATMMTITGYVRVLTILALVLAERS